MGGGVALAWTPLGKTWYDSMQVKVTRKRYSTACRPQEQVNGSASDSTYYLASQAPPNHRHLQLWDQ